MPLELKKWNITQIRWSWSRLKVQKWYNNRKIIYIFEYQTVKAVRNEQNLKMILFITISFDKSMRHYSLKLVEVTSQLEK